MKTSPFNKNARIATLLILALVSTAVHAQTVAFSNFSEAKFGTEALNSEYWVDQAFITTGADWATPLQSIAVKYSAQDVPVFAARLYSGDIVDKEVILTSVTELKLQGMLSTPSGTAIFTPVNSQLILDAGKTYWFAIELTSGTFSWDYVGSLISSGSGTFPAPPDFSLAGYTSDAGKNWTHDTGENQRPQYIEVTTAAIPEPSTYVGWAGLSALILAVWHRRRTFSGSAHWRVIPNRDQDEVNWPRTANAAGLLKCRVGRPGQFSPVRKRMGMSELLDRCRIDRLVVRPSTQDFL